MSIAIEIRKTARKFIIDKLDGFSSKRVFNNPVDAHSHALTIKNELESLNESVHVVIV